MSHIDSLKLTTLKLGATALALLVLGGSGAAHAGDPPEPIPGAPCELRGKSYPEGTILPHPFVNAPNVYVICDSGFWHNYTPPPSTIPAQKVTKVNIAEDVPDTLGGGTSWRPPAGVGRR